MTDESAMVAQAQTATLNTRRGPGRPSDYTDELAARIADAYAEGKSWREIAAMEDMPGRSTIEEWEEKREDFRSMLARARKAKAEAMAAKGLEILDAVDPESKFGSARVSKAREQAAYRRWWASCLDRDTFGDALKLDAKVQATTLTAFVDLTPRAPVGDAERDAPTYVPTSPVAYDEDARSASEGRSDASPSQPS